MRDVQDELENIINDCRRKVFCVSDHLGKPNLYVDSPDKRFPLVLPGEQAATVVASISLMTPLTARVSSRLFVVCR